jgi:hypothetical protein
LAIIKKEATNKFSFFIINIFLEIQDALLIFAMRRQI